MYDPNGKTNVELADTIRALQEDKGLTISAHSTLVKLRKEELTKRLLKLMGDKFGIKEDGQPVVVKKKETATVNAQVAIDTAIANADLEEELAEYQDAIDLDAEGVDVDDLDEEEVEARAATERTNAIFDARAAHDAKVNKIVAEKHNKGTKEIKEPKARGSRSPYNDDMVILTVGPNPKREGSSPHVRYACFQVGITVGEAVAAMIEQTGTDEHARASVAKAVRLKQITLGSK